MANDTAKNVGSGLIGAGAGGAQVYVLRTYADKPGSPAISQLGNWGYPSAIVDLATGAIASIVGVYTYMKKPIGGSKPLSAGIAGYGLTTLVGGMISGVKPVETTAQKVAAAATRVGSTVSAAQTAMQQAAAMQSGLRVVPTAAEKGGIVVRSLSM